MTDEQTLPDTPESANEEPSGKREPPALYQRLTVFIAVLLTFSAIFTLLSSWEERIYINELNYQIISTEFNRTQATILSQAQARQNYTIYSYYLINDLLDAGIRDIPETAESLTIAQRQAEFLASNNRYFFPGRYLKPDGSYDLERNIEEEFADRGRRTSLDSASERAYITEQMERKQHYMLVTFIFGIATVVLGFEMLFYWERRSIRFVLTVLGVALFILGVINYLALSPNPLIHLNLG